jgi:hypothetical protein
MWVRLCIELDKSMLAVDSQTFVITTRDAREKKARSQTMNDPPRKNNWCNYKHIVMPVHDVNHWFFVAIDLAAKKIVVVDCHDRLSSLKSVVWLDPIKTYLANEAKNHAISPSHWGFRMAGKHVTLKDYNKTGKKPI